MKCNYLLPKHDAFLTPNREMVECLLDFHVSGSHLSRCPNGKAIRWYFECADIDEGGCENIEECEDIVWWEVAESEISDKAH